MSKGSSRLEKYFSRRAIFYQGLHDGQAGALARYWWGGLRDYQDVALKLMGDLQGKRVLEIGCGVGELSILMSERGARVQAVDLSSRMIEVARHRAASRGASIEFEVQDFEAWDLHQAGSFDWIVAVAVFDYASAPNNWLLKMAVACQGLILTLPGRNPLQMLLRRFNGLMQGGLPLRFYGQEEASRMLETAGFRVNSLVRLHSTLVASASKADS